MDPTTGRLIELDGDVKSDMVIQSGEYLWVVGPSEFIDSETDRWIPTDVQLAGTYPNPFNPTTTIRFSLPEKAFTEVSVYDILGRRVALLLSSPLERGWHQTVFDASGLSSGMYIVVVRSGNEQKVRKITLMK
jgi:hypothetical protein